MILTKKDRIGALIIFLLSLVNSFKPTVARAEDVSTDVSTSPSRGLLNIRAMPIGMILGEYQGDVSIALMPSWSVGAVGYYANLESERVFDTIGAKGGGVGVTTAYHFSGRGFSDSWYLRAQYVYIPSIDFIQTQTLFGNTTYYGTVEKIGELSAMIGYHWVYGSGFNLSLALGVRTYTGVPESITLRTSDGTGTSTISGLSQLSSGVRAKAEFALGWAF